MKKLAGAALALLALLGMAGCDLGGSSGASAPASTLSDWKIKGSFDGWTLHQLSIDELDSKKLTFALDNLYAIDYEFVLVNPAGTEIKYNSGTKVTPGTTFTMGGTTNNVVFTAVKKAYTLEVNIATPTAPVANLVGGTAAALPVTNAILLSKLKLKGNQFNKIDDLAVASWTATAGTLGAATETWDVVVNNKTGEFGFDSLDGFLAKVDVDTAGLTAASSPATTAVELLSSGGTGSNSHLTNTTKDSNTYTLTVTVDASKAVNAGRYLLSVSLKALGSSNWAFAAPATVYVTGDIATGGWKQYNADRDAKTVSSGKAVWTYTSTAADAVKGWKFSIGTDDWGGLLGYGAAVDTASSTVAISDAGGSNLGFTAVQNHVYTITVDFSGTFTTTGVPVLTIQDTTPAS